MTSKNSTLTHEYLTNNFSYNRKSGILIYKKSNSNCIKIGQPAGCKYSSRSGKEYLRINIQGTHYLVHRVIWFICYGGLPKYQIDHINGDGVDNRIKNLRDVPQPVNMKNLKKYSTNVTGVTGVYWSKNRNKWESKIGIRGELLNLGSFATFNDAVISRKMAEQEYGYHKNHGDNPK